MSLINDALKRAQQAHPPVIADIAGGPPLNSAPGSAEAATRSSFPSVTGILVLVSVLAAGAYFLRSTQGGKAEVRARVTQPATVAPKPKTTSAHSHPAPGGAETASPAEVAHAPAPAPVPAPAGDQAAAAAPMAPEMAKPLPMPVLEPIPAVVPKTPVLRKDLRLQAIFAHPKNPSAIVNGKSVFVGEWLGDLKLTAVTTDSVTLSSAAGQQILHLAR